MTPERWNKIKALFSSAQDVAEAERDQFLSRECGDDTKLKAEIEKLLDSDKRDDEFLDKSAVAEVASSFEVGSTDGRLRDASEMASPRFDPGAFLNERYEIVRLLGRGGMGEVYLASDTRIKRDVALKVLHSDLVSSKESLRRFALEAEAVSALNHPHIMTIYEVDTTAEGSLFFVAEYVDGQPLNHLIGSELGADKALEIAIQVASALAAAHEAGITHRDIKPENIMVRRDGYVKVLDFGLAKLTQKSQLPSSSAGSEDPTVGLQRTKPGAVMGTASYMSPEQARGLHVDARTDIWSLGAVIYEMLTGRRPFLGDTSADIIVSVLSTEPPPLSSYGRNLPAELEWVVTKALSKDVEARYQTTKGLRADLERIKKKIEFDESLSRSGQHEAPDHDVEKRENGEPGVPTAGGEARTTSGGAEESAAAKPFMSATGSGAGSNSTRNWIGSLLLLAVAVFGVGAFVRYFFLATPSVSAQIDSIAVLPFENLSGNADLAYVSDGLSEALIDRFAQVPRLKVISRNSSFKFRGTDVDVRNAASQMGVRAVVTGTVTKVGDDLAIRVDIVDATENRQLAGGSYRRRAGDLINVQGEIAQATSEQLRLKLDPTQAKRLTEIGTEDSEAYRYYLNGLVESNSPQAVGGRALEYFQKAVELDPDFAAAHAEIAWSYWTQANASDDPAVIMPKARASTERALALDPTLAKAHVAKAVVHEYDFDWRAAEAEYRRAIELNPNLDFARNNYAFFLSVMGRQTEALAELEQQQLLDPINRRLGLLHKAIVLVQARKFDEALQAYAEAQAADPTREVPSFALGYAYAGKGRIQEAVTYYKKSIDLLGGEEKYSQPLVYLAATYAKMPDKRGEARAILTRIETTSRYASPALLAAVYAPLGENDKAIELLEKAYVKRDLLLRYIGSGYEYDALRSDARFTDLMKRIGLSQVQQ